MTLRWTHLGAGLGGLGALGVAPYLAGIGMLSALGWPWDDLRPGLAWAFWQVRDLPEYAPYATRIRWGGGLGLALAPLGWATAVAVVWWRRRRHGPSHAPVFARASALAPIWPDASSARLPDDASALIVAPDYPRAADALWPALRTLPTPLLIVDIDGALYAATAGWRATLGPVRCIAPLGEGTPWNPLAAACHAEGLDPDAVRTLVDGWYATGTPLMTSLVGLAFRALLGVVNDTLRHAGDSSRPAPGDLARLAHTPLRRAALDHLATRPGLTANTQADLTAWRRADDDTLDAIERHLRPPLAAFLAPERDTSTRGTAVRLEGTVFLTVPYRRRADVVPLLNALLGHYRHPPTVVVHGLDLLPPLPHVPRLLATAVSMHRLLDMHGKDADRFARRFRFVTWQGPGQRADTDNEIEALGAYLSAHGHHGKRLAADAFRAALQRLRARQQAVVSPALWPPVRCRVATCRPPTPTTPRPHHEGEPMKRPLSIAALLASLATLQTKDAHAWPIVYDAPARAIPSKVVSLGPHRFRLPMNIFDGQDGYNPEGTVILLALRWPTLEALPMGVNYHDINEDFISTIRIAVTYFSRLSDEQARDFLRHNIHPGSGADRFTREDPADNLELRLKGDAHHGLTPYYLDTERLKAYYSKEFGPQSPAVTNADDWGEDWYVRMDDRGIPLTHISCTTRLRPDGVAIIDHRPVDDVPARSRATCTHQFILPQYKALVSVDYLRVMLPDWKRMEDRVIAILRNAEVVE